MAADPAQAARWEAEGRQAVVRLKMPRQGQCRFRDLIRGDVEFEWAAEQDHVIQRADGTCLYHLASVVDDRDFEITHVIRAVEHLSNTPRQVFIAQGLGCQPPQYAHLPYVAEPGSSSKLSKRKLDKYLKHADFHKLFQWGRKIAQAAGRTVSPETFNPVVVDFYRDIGFLPEAVVNYLLLLGWSLDDKTEEFTRDEMIRAFSLDRVNKAPASFDPQKLTAFQERAMRALPLERKTALAVPYLQQAGLVPDPLPPAVAAQVVRIVQAAGDRLRVAGDILEYADFFTPDDRLTYDEQAFDKRLRKAAAAAGLLGRFRQQLAAADSFQAAALERLLQAFLQAEGVEVGELIHALRVAVTGKAVGFGMFETLEILWPARSLARIDLALDRLAGHAP
jgi:glutamyl-tRNA synthetase